MAHIDTSFIIDIINHLLDYAPVLSNIIDRYTTVVNYYSYLFMGLLPFYLYADPYFVVKNITHLYITLACCLYLYNKSMVLFAGVPTTFILDRIFRLPYDSIVYIMVFVVIATIAEFTYTLVNMFNYVVTNPQLYNFIDAININRETVQVDEQSEEQTERSEEQTEQSDEQSEEQPAQPEEHPEERPEENPEERPEEQPAQPEEQPAQPEEQPNEQPIQSEITPVDDDLSDLLELI